MCWLIIFPWCQLSPVFLCRGLPVNSANYPTSQNSPCDLRHTPGAANVVADTLTRPPPPSPPAPLLPPPPGVKVSEVSEVSEVPEVSEVSVSLVPSPFPTFSVINFSELAKEQLACPDILRLKSSPTLQIITVPVQNGSLLCDAKTKVLRPLVPSSQRFNIFSALHGISHPGIRASRRLISTRFVWRGLANDVRDWFQSCLPCQRGKILRNVQIRPEKIPVPFRRFSHVPMVSHISSRASTGQQDGRKLYLWLEFVRWSVPPPCFTDGYRGLAFLQLLQVTEELSSPHPYGLPSAPC